MIANLIDSKSNEVRYAITGVSCLVKQNTIYPYTRTCMYKIAMVYMQLVFNKRFEKLVIRLNQTSNLSIQFNPNQNSRTQTVFSIGNKPYSLMTDGCVNHR